MGRRNQDDFGGGNTNTPPVTTTNPTIGSPAAIDPNAPGLNPATRNNSFLGGIPGLQRITNFFKNPFPAIGRAFLNQAGGQQYYQVRPRDTLSGVASSIGVSPQQLSSYNAGMNALPPPGSYIQAWENRGPVPGGYSSEGGFSQAPAPLAGQYETNRPPPSGNVVAYENRPPFTGQEAAYRGNPLGATYAKPGDVLAELKQWDLRKAAGKGMPPTMSFAAANFIGSQEGWTPQSIQADGYKPDFVHQQYVLTSGRFDFTNQSYTAGPPTSGWGSEKGPDPGSRDWYQNPETGNWRTRRGPKGGRHRRNATPPPIPENSSDVPSTVLALRLSSG